MTTAQGLAARRDMRRFDKFHTLLLRAISDPRARTTILIVVERDGGNPLADHIHELFRNLEKGLYRCPFCARTFARPQGLVAHLGLNHTCIEELKALYQNNRHSKNGENTSKRKTRSGKLVNNLTV